MTNAQWTAVRDRLMAEVDQLTRERDEARAVVEAARALVAECDRGHYPADYKGQRVGGIGVSPATRRVVRDFLAGPLDAFDKGR